MPAHRPLFVALLAAWLGASAAVDDPAAPTPEQELLARAEREYAKGRYPHAIAAYKELAERFPQTPEGQRAARRCLPSGFLGSAPIGEAGPSANRVDIAVMGDGFQLDDQKGFDKLAEDVPAMFDKQKTFGEYLSYFNFHRVNLVSKDDGVDGYGREEDTALNAHTIGTIQGHVAIDRDKVFAMLREMGENDGLAVVFVRTGVLGTGGGGIATIGGRSADTLVHEWGHAFCGLGDEYSSKTHDRGKVGRTVNVSPVEDPVQVPWAHWIEAKVPGVGVYEGAAGQARGAWKATSGGCVMEDGDFFCPPCGEEIVLHVYRHVDPIDEVTPEPSPASRHGRDGDAHEALRGEEPHEFAVRVLQPANHSLEVRFWVLPERDAPESPDWRPRPGKDRSSRGKLPPIAAAPQSVERNVPRDGWVKFRLDPRALAPGIYRVVVRVNDPTKLRSERFPWVLRDEDGVLESERGWWVVVDARGE